MTESRRILYVVNAFETDAPTIITIAFGNAMKAAGWEVLFIAWSRGGPMYKVLSQNGLAPRVLGDGFLANLIQLRQVICGFKPHIVHSVLARPTIAFALTRLVLSNHRSIWVAGDHGVHEWHEKGKFYGRFMEAIIPSLLSGAGAVCTVSESAGIDLTQRGLNPDIVQVVPNGIDIVRFKPNYEDDRARERDSLLAQEFPWSNGKCVSFLIGSAGNLRSLKGYDDLIDALPGIMTVMPNVFCLIWGIGPERDRLIAKAEQLGIAQAVRFCGFDKMIEGKLPLLDLYVQPSRVESFGMAAAEAMACGVPVIVSDAGGLKELVQEGSSGKIFPAGDVAALMDAIVNLALDREKLILLGKGGRQRIEKHYTKDLMLEKMHRIYQKLLINGPLNE